MSKKKNFKKVKIVVHNTEPEFEATYRLASKSFGFATLDTGEEIWISTKDSMHAMNDDKVLVKILNRSSGKSREGKITKIISKKNDTLVGIFEKNKNYAFVTPINKKIPFDIHIEKKYFGKAIDGSLVEVKILSAKNHGDNPEGVVLNVIGHKDDASAEITAIVRDFKIKDIFDEDTIVEADKVAVPIEEKDLKDRVDLRDKCFITIDGADTKDIDDAICLELLENGNKKLYVSIADVSHYVKEGSALDREALIRGNSVYLLDRVIPMLPRVLSNGMCSLNEGEDRLSMTCEMEYDKDGNQVSHNIYKSIIRSKKRMTYDEVQGIYDDIDVPKDINREIEIMLISMLELSRAIRKKREKRGAINFNLKETYIEVDRNLVPISVRERVRIEANELIEDFMVVANETVAEEFFKKKIPFIYRTHEKCDDEKIKTLSNTLINIGVPFTYRSDIRPKDIQNLLQDVYDKPYQYVVERLALRSMSQARYTKEELGHFALAAKYYSHFTSPIRRYSDLQIHRIMKEVLYGNFDEKRKEHYESILDDVALNISKTERVAIDCERDIDDLKKCEYMYDKLGEEYDGTISGLTNFGIFVELPDTIEGMVALRDIKDDHYVFDEEKFQVIGERTKKIYTFGQKVRVQLVKVTPSIRAIDFIFV